MLFVSKRQCFRYRDLGWDGYVASVPDVRQTGMKRLVLGAFLFCIPACRGDRARVTVRNRSNGPIEALHLSGKCFDENVGALAAGDVAEVRVRPCGESGVETRFTVNGVPHTTPAAGYIEASSTYDERLEIGPDYKVTLDQ